MSMLSSHEVHKFSAIFLAAYQHFMPLSYKLAFKQKKTTLPATQNRLPYTMNLVEFQIFHFHQEHFILLASILINGFNFDG